jgi:segregation and condensation protein B
MDREECAVLTGEASSLSCVPDLEAMEPALSDACEAARLDAESTPAGDISPAQVIEALLFSADTPLTAARLGELCGIRSTTQVRLHIADLNDKYAAAGLSFRIEEIARGYQMMTQPEYRPWLAKLNRQQAQTRLSPAALETLSIVAYKQPVIRADIEAIRGVGSGEVLNRLREMGLVKIVGRAEIVGRPMLYGTTRKFLDIFGLADLEDLPPMEMLPLRRAATLAEAPVAAETGS